MSAVVTSVVAYGKPPLKRVAIGAAAGPYLLGRASGKKDIVFRAAPGEMPVEIGRCPELTGYHSIAMHATGLYVSGSSGVFRSTDEAASWQEIAVESGSAAPLGIATDARGILWVGFRDAMAWSRDGDAWTHVKMRGGAPTPLAGTIYVVNSGTVAMWNGEAFQTIKVGDDARVIARSERGLFLVLGDHAQVATGEAGTLPQKWRKRKVEALTACGWGDAIFIASSDELLVTRDGEAFDVVAKFPKWLDHILPVETGVWLTAGLATGADEVAFAGALWFLSTGYRAAAPA